jgi:hypothetical protein
MFEWVLLFLSFCLQVSAQNVVVEMIPKTGTPPPERLYSAMVNVNKVLYIFGGSDFSGKSLDEFHSFDIQT